LDRRRDEVHQGEARGDDVGVPAQRGLEGGRLAVVLARVHLLAQTEPGQLAVRPPDEAPLDDDVGVEQVRRRRARQPAAVARTR